MSSLISCAAGCVAFFDDEAGVSIMFDSWERIHGEAVVPCPDNEKDLLMPETTGEDYDNQDGDGWAEGGEMEDFEHLPYPAVWNDDTDDEVIHAALAWQRAVELLTEQGYAPQECEADAVVRRCRAGRGR
ncbi:hypothetical protein [Amycolatopsis pigmentata]|uniref:Uncharacterized protein n=1 Tax=Amycolatopsis pigmentata TaxID=450801 RepID=A0ABW5FNF2_9PSEU